MIWLHKLSATINSRAKLRLDIGFYIGAVLLLKSSRTICRGKFGNRAKITSCDRGRPFLQLSSLKRLKRIPD